MTDDTHDDTIDWNQFWREADDDARESAVPSAHHVRGMLADFFAEKGAPDSFASVGCGPGVVAFDVAERHPATTVVGYDAAEPILAENRERARED
ncbi:MULTISPECIES: class I SAM-dependent methyltransferase [Halostella]|uniref:class I SAM-dependent methyltransferase n=1 Tax=Halostella TaxID=1843185 RepID=UPI00196512CE|nr:MULTISPECIES: class I SAM-dependent methyltransferase [Halostella]